MHTGCAAKYDVCASGDIIARWPRERLVELIDFMMAHPILINRPIVETPRGSKLCRPSELVLNLLDNPVTSFTKEDGEQIAYKRKLR